MVYHAGMIGEEGGILLDICQNGGVNTEFIQKISGKSWHTIIQVDKNGLGTFWKREYSPFGHARGKGIGDGGKSAGYRSFLCGGDCLHTDKR